MKRYLPSFKRYSWILLVCTILAVLIGYGLAKAQPTAYLANASLLVDAGAPGTTYPGATANITDSITRAAFDAAEIPTRSVMEFVYQFDPAIAQHHFVADDLLTDITVVAPSTTTSALVITGLAPTPNTAVMLANDAAKGYQAYKLKQSQDQLAATRKSLQDQISFYGQQKAVWEKDIASLASTNDPHYTIYNNDLTDVTHTIGTLQSQLLQLPTAVKSDIFITQLAKLTDVTSSSKTSLLVAATGLVGLLLGTLVMLLLIFLDDRLRGDDLVKEKLGLAYIGGLSNNNDLKRTPMRLTGTSAQQFGDICANLRLTNILPGDWRAPHGAVLLVTSSRSAEGKTTVTAALAATVANGGGSVVVVEGNLRQPGTHLAFGMSPAGVGLNGLLKSSGGEGVDSAVQRTNIPGVWVLAATAAVDTPAFLLDQRLPAILAQLRNRADLIIIDGPALLSGAEAAVLATMVDGVAVVLDSRHDKLAMLLRAKEVLMSLAHAPSGVILNYLPRIKRDGYYATPYQPGPISLSGKPAHARSEGHNGNGAENGKGTARGQESASVAFLQTARVPSSPPPVPATPSRPWSQSLSGQPEPMLPPRDANGLQQGPAPARPSVYRGDAMPPLSPRPTKVE